MATNDQVDVDEYAAAIVEALVGVIGDAADEDTLRVRNLMLQRLAVVGDIVPSRVPAPRNITEVGGYLNLLESTGEPILRAQALAAILGVAGPTPPVGFDPTGPVRFPVTRRNDRPAGIAQPSIPVTFTVRDDLAGPLDDALTAIHGRGGSLPILRTLAPLPPVDQQPAADPLAYLGRELRLVPAVALRDPDDDPIAVARLDSGGELRTVGRIIDEGAPDSGEVSAEDWVAWRCDESGCAETTGSRRYFDLAESLEPAGWYQATPQAPDSLVDAGGWDRWTNITGLVAGMTTLGDELRSLCPPAAITASALRDRTTWIWDGDAFQPTS